MPPSKGPRVKALQEGLLKLGYKMPRYGADSDFGAETEAVVRQFQLDHGQPVDSVWDLDCQAKLTAAFPLQFTPLSSFTAPALARKN